MCDGAALQRPLDGPPGMLAAQFAHLAACADQPHIQIQVVPADTPVYPGLQGGFILATLPDGSTVAHLDHQVRAQVVAECEDIATLQKTWESIHGQALPCRQSLHLLTEAAQRWT
ncbi:hypothetical protein HCJ94_11895 [Micromonospora sp. HSS6-12]|uniref:DUF5753 domain-containing protein n=1 Tax=Micromonospora thermarum TaxID=2720024 RepID=A0ABX0Z4C5_9ACTN|nr:hypothetical protein [Micromonospora thermarum]